MPLSDAARPDLPTGLVAFVKRDCPTCELVAPVLEVLAAGQTLTVYTQDDPEFPAGLDPIDDTQLECSWRHGIEVVPTLLRVEKGREIARAIGWHRGDWVELTGVSGLGHDLPELRPGCGSRSVDPDLALELAVRFGGSALQSRRVTLAPLEDEMEALFDRGWSDGLPLVPPTEKRVLAMLEGTKRAPDEIVAEVPPDLVPCTVEKVAINAVMAGCRSDYLPVVLAAVEAACTDAFNMHGLLATTMPTGPVIIVNGPIRRAIGMNFGRNVFGQGNRANLTIGRALQLVVRNMGGGRPGEVDRATFGNPGKLAFCFAEDEEGSPWTPLSTDLGAEPGQSTVTLFPGEGPRSIVDQLSRDPESLARSYAVNLRTLHHPKMVLAFDCLLAIGPEHARVFEEAGWSKEQLVARLHELLVIPKQELVRGAGGIAEGMPEDLPVPTLPKFRPGGILVVHCGGEAGLFSAMIGGWVTGEMGSQPVLREIRA
ncbi:MAG: thioredoxin family protein [Deltaproteobacteria bacterium]|nr:thioredoxin family protein [Deltaproteobacteria bacterium]MBW2695667.1 thioredoxin family protein [Deltaproteobacteria bacterium]